MERDNSAIWEMSSTHKLVSHGRVSQRMCFSAAGAKSVLDHERAYKLKVIQLLSHYGVYTTACLLSVYLLLLPHLLYLSFLPATDGMKRASKPTHKNEGPVRLVVALKVR